MLSNSTHSFWNVGISLASILLGMFAFSWPMARLADWLVWLSLVALEILLLKQIRTNEHVRIKESSSTFLQSLGEPLASDASNQEYAKTNEIILQQITRVRGQEALAETESIFGTLSAEFQPNERTQTLHIAFCPPLATVPHIDVEQIEGADATIKVTNVLRHGARFEIRLIKESPEKTIVTLEFAAHE